MLPKRRVKPSAVSKRAPASRYYRSTIKSGASPFVKKQPTSRSRHLLTRVLDVIIVAVILVGFLYSLILQPSPKIVASDLSYRPINAYQLAATSQLHSLKNRNKLTIDGQAISTSLKKQFPEIVAASVSLPLLGQRPVVHLDIPAPSFFLSSGSHLYVIDSAGIATAQASSLPKVKNLPTVSDQSGFDIKIGDQVLSVGAVSFINQLAAQCKHANVPIASLVLPPLAQELDLHTSDKPYYVKFYLGSDASLQIGQFLASRSQFALSHKDPSQYLDVRVAGRVYYK